MTLPRIPRMSPAQRAALDSLREEQRNNPQKLSPCVLQTREDIEAYYRNAEAGQAAVVRHTQGNLLRYAILEIEDINPRRGRVYIRNHGAFYMKSGANCFHPKGQTS